jgi:hypothetical protein
MNVVIWEYYVATTGQRYGSLEGEQSENEMSANESSANETPPKEIAPIHIVSETRDSNDETMARYWFWWRGTVLPSRARIAAVEGVVLRSFRAVCVVGFGTDLAGELYTMSYANGVSRLVPRR